MATPNYGYEKRQRELAKKKKKEEKLKAKADRRHDEGGAAQDGDAGTTDAPGDAPAAGEGSGRAD